MERQPLTIPTRRDERRSMDFVADALSDGRRFRSLNIVDDFNRECLAAEVDTSIPGARLVRLLQRLGEVRGLPEVLVNDNMLPSVLSIFRKAQNPQGFPRWPAAS